MGEAESRQIILRSIARQLDQWLSDLDHHSAPASAELGEKPKEAEPPCPTATTFKRANIHGCC